MMFPWRSRSLLTGILPTGVLMAAGAVFAQGLSGPRYSISKADIAKELGVIGVSAETSQIHIPVGISAAGISPKLEVVTVEPIGNDQVRLQLRCSTSAECLPFFATLDVKEASLLIGEIRAKTDRPVATDEQKALQVVVGSASQPQIKVGSHAVLIIRDGHLDIHLQVLAIDTGVLGQQVRVSTLDRKKVFHATVTGEGTVTGAIE